MTNKAQLSWTRFLAMGILFAALAACGGSSSSPPPAPLYTVGGIGTGLTGSGLVLQNTAGGDLAVSAPGPFTFTAGLTNGAAYAVTVKTQPSSPTQNCVVTNGSGTVHVPSQPGVHTPSL